MRVIGAVFVEESRVSACLVPEVLGPLPREMLSKRLEGMAGWDHGSL